MAIKLFPGPQCSFWMQWSVPSCELLMGLVVGLIMDVAFYLHGLIVISWGESNTIVMGAINSDIDRLLTECV